MLTDEQKFTVKQLIEFASENWDAFEQRMKELGLDADNEIESLESVVE